MKTEIFREPDEKALREIAAVIRRGGTAALPTETVYGLAADAANPAAVRKIFEAKGRPSDNPLIVHISDVGQAAGFTDYFGEKATALAGAFWPGPLTMIFPARREVLPEVTGRLGTVALRMPANDFFRRIIDYSGRPLAAPSANVSGRPSPTRAEHVIADLNGRIDAVLDGGACRLGVESTVLDMTGERPVILRPGSITAGELEQVLGTEIVHHGGEKERNISPGMKYRHYAPDAEVILIAPGRDGEPEGFAEMLLRESGCRKGLFLFDESLEALPPESVKDTVIYRRGSREDLEESLALLYDALRFFDRENVEKVFVETVREEGLGITLMNRLRKAASKK